MRRGIGSDPRIGYHCLYAGANYGDSCSPKDVEALIRSAADSGSALRVLSAVEAANDAQKSVLVDKVVRRFGDDLEGRHFEMWGLAFKADTDDMRGAPGRVVIEALLARRDGGSLRSGCDERGSPHPRRSVGADVLARRDDRIRELISPAGELVLVVSRATRFSSRDNRKARARSSRYNRES